MFYSLAKKSFTTLFLGSVIFAEAKAPQKVEIDPAATTIKWEGKKITEAHSGGIALKSGTLEVDELKPVSGSFVIDMNTMSNTDIKDPKSSAKLVTHLKGEDFFATDKFPEAKLTIESSMPKGAPKDREFIVAGHLTIKGITHPVSFPAKVELINDRIRSTSVITFDRTKFDIKYRSGKFFAGLADKAILDEIKVDVVLLSKPVAGLKPKIARN